MNSDNVFEKDVNDVEDFEEKNIRNAKIMSLTKIVEVIPDPNIYERDIMNCTIELTTKDGQRVSSNISAIKGNPLNPMSLGECMEKFRKCAEYSPKTIDEEKLSEILNILKDLEFLEDIKNLMSLLH